MNNPIEPSSPTPLAKPAHTDNKSKVPVHDHPHPNAPVEAYGGIVIDAERKRVLLREPSHHFGGYVWTFAKGRPDRAETPATTALREISEELGCEARILVPIPGAFKGDTSRTAYYLMQFIGERGAPDAETSAVCWATWEEAVALINQTRHRTGRLRDLAVLEAANICAASLPTATGN